MENTELCIDKQFGQVEKVYGYGISNLKKNNPSSFLIAPILTDGHAFCSLIRRTNEGLSVTLINASAAVYNFFRDIAKTKHALNVASRDQKIANCIFK